MKRTGVCVVGGGPAGFIAAIAAARAGARTTLVESFGFEIGPYRTVFSSVEQAFIQAFQHFFLAFKIGV